MTSLDYILTDFFKHNRSIEQQESLVVAVSGGRDSLCLLHWLTHSADVEQKIIVVTVDHRLRPESTAECEQVCQIATQWGAECHICQTELTPETFSENSGRLARYTILQDVARQSHAQHILTGHHAGDQAETVLLHLLRGSGLTGLTGMRQQLPLDRLGLPSLLTSDHPADQPLILVRPMLTVTPTMLDKYAAEHNLTPIEDPSNENNDYTRNRLRNRLIPLLEDQYNPQIQKALSQMADILQDDWTALEAIHAKTLAQADPQQGFGWRSLDFQVWKDQNASFQRYALRQLYAQLYGSTQDLTQGNLEAVRSGLAEQKTDKQYQLSETIWVRKGYGALLVYHVTVADQLFDFAASINGYDLAGGFHEYVEIASSPNRNSVDELRIAMFFHLRALRHSGEDLDVDDVKLLREYTARIREILVERENLEGTGIRKQPKRGDIVVNMPETKSFSFGGCSFEKLSPKLEKLDSKTKVLNVTLSFEDALKLNLAIDECVRKLNSYKRSTSAGKRSALNVAIHLEKGRITVNEGKI